MDFEWDEAKNARSLRERGIDFASIRQFDWQTADVRPDTRHDYGEDRYRALGMIGDRLYQVAFVLRGPAIRVISLRKANTREQREYDRLTDPG